jgi:hypothetical protein
MRYFLDTEFIEGFRKPLFGKPRWGIDLISIGIVGEDGSEYYAISTDFNPRHANDWVKKNVLSKLPQRYVGFHGSSPTERREAALWKSNKEIKSDLLNLFRCGYEDGMIVAPSGIEVYGYYADYDWVLLASLFGTMMDLPTGFPMYCRDLKQTVDEKVMTRYVENPHKAVHTFNNALEWLKQDWRYPKQKDEHNALADAKWNYELYKFLQKL